MDYRGNYVPKKHGKLGYRIVVPFLLLLLAGCLMIYTFYKPSQQEVDTSLNVCKMNHRETRSLITRLEKERSEEGTESLVFSDYGQYGETLGFYQNQYKPGTRDPFNGKTVFLNNVCSDEESTYLMGVDLDSKIPLEFLEDGFYEVELLSGLTRSRLVSEEKIDDTVYTISRNGRSKKIRIFANSALFDFEEHKILNENVLYLEVSSDDEHEKYDIAIDPSGLTLYNDGVTNYGNQYNGVVEADEMYDVALKLKEKLEAKGLRVLVLRDNETPINVFGEDGRIAKGYEADAKYYIQLNLLYSGYKSDVGATMIYSNFSSNRIATSIMKALNEQTSLKASNYSSGHNIDGVYRTQLVDNLDLMNIIRETGGKFTGAGINEDFKELNGFAKDIRKGMQTVVVEYGYLNDDETFATWKNEKEAIIEATYEGILSGLGIE